MVRAPCCDERLGLKKGPWTPDEDQKLVAFIQEHGHGNWRALPEKAGTLTSHPFLVSEQLYGGIWVPCESALVNCFLSNCRVEIGFSVCESSVNCRKYCVWEWWGCNSLVSILEFRFSELDAIVESSCNVGVFQGSRGVAKAAG